MNAKQTVSLVAAGAKIPGLGPWIVVGGLVIAGIVYFSQDKKPKTAPKVPPLPPPDPSNFDQNTAENRGFPPESTEKPSQPIIAPIPEELPPPLPSKKPIIFREDIARIFHDGTRALYRKDAVAELQNLGFGKTAAYEALSTNGRFRAWLQIAPDGIITWTN
jgi:hypothetical protein